MIIICPGRTWSRRAHKASTSSAPSVVLVPPAAQSAELSPLPCSLQAGTPALRPVLLSCPNPRFVLPSVSPSRSHPYLVRLWSQGTEYAGQVRHGRLGPSSQIRTRRARLVRHHPEPMEGKEKRRRSSRQQEFPRESEPLHAPRELFGVISVAVFDLRDYGACRSRGTCPGLPCLEVGFFVIGVRKHIQASRR